MPYVTCSKAIDDMPQYPGGAVVAFFPGQSVFVHESVRHFYVGNPDFVISETNPDLGDVLVKDPETGAVSLNPDAVAEAGGSVGLSSASTARVGAAEVLTRTGFNTVAAGSVKYEPRTVANVEPMEVVSNLYSPIDVGAISGMIFAIDTATRRKLFQFDGVAFTQVGDFSADNIIQIAKEVQNASETAIVVVTHATSATQAGVKVYRSTNGGESWALVNNIADGWGVAPSETAWAKGGMMMFGEYFTNTNGRYPRLWYTSDAGATWVMHQSTTRNGGHTHWIDDVDGTAAGGWFVTFGDGTYSGIIKITFDGSTFTEIDVRSDVETHCLKKIGSGRWLRSEYSIAAFDPLTFGQSVKHQIMDDSASGKFPYGNRSYGFRSVFEYRGVLYACFTAYAGSTHPNGLYASADDGDTWVCVFRSDAATFGGFRCGFGLGDYVYMQPMGGLGTPELVRFRASSAKIVKTARVDQAVRNVIATSGLSTFTNANGTAVAATTAGGGWGTDVSYENPANGAPSLVEVIPGGFDGSGHQLHFVTKAAGVAGNNNIVSSPALSVLCAGSVPVAGDYFVATARFRAPNFPHGKYSIIFYIRGVPAADIGFRSFRIAGSEWMELVCYGKWIATPTSIDRFWLRVDNLSTDAATNEAFDCYFDSVKLFVSKTPMWVYDNRNGIIGQPVGADTVYSDVAQSSSGTIAWRLSNSGAIEQPDGVLATVLCAANTKMTVSYSAGRYVFSDGITSVQTSVRKRNRDDVVNFAVTYGAETKMYVMDSGNPSIESVTLASTAKRPYSVVLGGDPSAGSFTAGNFFGLVVNQSESSLLDVSSLFDSSARF